MVNKVLITIACLLYPLNHFISVLFYPLYETIQYDDYTDLRYKLITVMILLISYINKFHKEDRYVNFLTGVLVSFCASDLVSRFVFNENYFELKKDLFSILLVIAFEFYKYGNIGFRKRI